MINSSNWMKTTRCPHSETPSFVLNIQFLVLAFAKVLTNQRNTFDCPNHTIYKHLSLVLNLSTYVVLSVMMTQKFKRHTLAHPEDWWWLENHWSLHLPQELYYPQFASDAPHFCTSQLTHNTLHTQRQYCSMKKWQIITEKYNVTPTWFKRTLKSSKFSTVIDGIK